MKIFSRIMLAAAAASMAVLPVAAEAGTRASSASSTVSAPGKGRVAKGEKAKASGWVWGIIGVSATGLAIWGIVRATGGQGDCRSPRC